MYDCLVTFRLCSSMRLPPCGHPRDLSSCSRDSSPGFGSSDPDRSFRHPKWLTMSPLFSGTRCIAVSFRLFSLLSGSVYPLSREANSPSLLARLSLDFREGLLEGGKV